MTIYEYFRESYDPARLVGRAPETRAQYVTCCLAWASWPETVEIDQVTSAKFGSFLGYCLAQKKAPATVNKYRRHLLAIFRHAHRQGVLPRVPEVPTVPEPGRLPEAWTVADVERILSEARREEGMIGNVPAWLWWPSLLRCLYDTGSRISALLQTRPQDLSMADRWIVIRGDVTKTKRPEFHSLSDGTIAAIAPIYSVDAEHIWPWPWTPKRIYPRFRRILQRAGVRYGRDRGGLFHKMRKTSASLIAANGGDPQQHLGHGSASVTWDHYVDPRIAGRGQLGFLPTLGDE